jgi:aminoglycoside 6-adenylyltransferase
MFRDGKSVEGTETLMRLVLYEDRTKVDFALWPAALVQQLVDWQRLPDLLDWGYQILLDKDDLVVGLPAPTYRAHIPARPTEQAYLALVEEFWWESIYVAKHLWRDELVHAKYNLEVVMKHTLLVRMLDWRAEIDHRWAWKPGPMGSGLKKHLPAELWSAFAATYVGADLEENWDALFATASVFRQAATDVAQALGYTYPLALDQRVLAYLHQIHRLQT